MAWLAALLWFASRGHDAEIVRGGLPPPPAAANIPFVPTALGADEGDVLAGQERDALFRAIYERMTKVRPLSRFKTRGEWEAFAKALRPRILNALGLQPLPKRVDLKPHVSGRLVREGYTVERVWFQAFPKVYASAYLYVPDVARKPRAKLPAILHPHGHWPEGAADPTVQARCIALAKIGYVGLCPDSTHVADFPTGLCPVGQMTWNNIRALDFLETLPYVNKAKIGCTGASGGGQQTMYLGAVDDRVKVLVPAVMVCYFKRILFASQEAHHFCNHVPGIAAIADQTEMAAMFAPRPTLFICATGDWTLTVPKEEFPDMKHVWDLTGGVTEVVQFDKPHNYDRDSRERMYAWFNRHLKRDADPAHAKEPAVETEDPNTLRALGGPPPGGAGLEAATAYYRNTYRFKEATLDTRDQLNRWKERDHKRLKRHLGLDARRPRIASERRAFFGTEGLSAEVWRLFASDDPVPFRWLPAWYFRPKGVEKSAPGVVIAHPEGKRALLTKRSGLVRSLVERGIGVLALDVRMRGELKRDWRWNLMIWGMPEAVCQTLDIEAGIRFLASKKEIDPKRVYVAGLGDQGVAALIASSFTRECAGAALDDIGLTYRAGRELPDLPGLLRLADLPQIAALSTPKRLWINGAKEPFAFTSRAYLLSKANDQLWIAADREADFDAALAGWVLRATDAKR